MSEGNVVHKAQSIKRKWNQDWEWDVDEARVERYLYF